MVVTFRNVIDRANMMFEDYRLDKFYQSDINAYYSYMYGFVLNSIDMFSGCLVDLSYTEITVTEDDLETHTDYQFDNELTSKIVYILALGTVISWMEKNNKDVEQMNLHMNAKEFRNYSEAQSLSKKQDALYRMMEDYDNKITEYQLMNLSSMTFFNANTTGGV